MRKLIYAFCGLFLAGALLGNTGCGQQPPTARDANVAVQKSLMARATATVPVPQVSNFLSREAVAKQVKRLDEKGKLFYVYILADNGQQMGYYVSNTRPVSVCALLTPPDDLGHVSDSLGHASQLMKAPGLGGTYGGGDCRAVFFFDAQTDTYIEVNGLNYFVSDQPLSVKSDPITVKAVQ